MYNYGDLSCLAFLSTILPTLFRKPSYSFAWESLLWRRRFVDIQVSKVLFRIGSNYNCIYYLIGQIILLSNKIFYINISISIVQMQKSQLVQSFLKKKQMISKMISESKSPRKRQQFKHFEAISEPTYIKAETHLNTEFRDQLRQFVNENQSFNQTMAQLDRITQNVQNEKSSLQKQYRKLRIELNELELQKQVLTDKNNFHLDKIITLQQQTQNSELKKQENEVTATYTEEQIQYQKCMTFQIQKKNAELIQKLQIKLAQIQTQTSTMETEEKEMRRNESELKNINQDIQSMYFTLQAQDGSLTTLCDVIQSVLNKQSNHINDIEFIKNDLTHSLTQSEKRKSQLQKESETQQQLFNYFEDIKFQIGRTQKQKLMEEKGVSGQCWRIEKEKERYIQNREMLIQLQQYLGDLIYKNQMLQQQLQVQIIQDHTIKKIVDSKCSQPVGMKTKIFLQELQQKQLTSTNSSFKQNSKLSPKYSQTKPQKQSLINKSHKLPKKQTQQMEFAFERFRQNNFSRIQINHQFYEQKDQKMNTGFTQINTLEQFKAEI